MKHCHWYALLAVILSLAFMTSASTLPAAETPTTDRAQTPLQKFASPGAGSWSSQVVTSSPRVATITPASFGEVFLNTEPDGSGEDFTLNTPAFDIFDFYVLLHVDFAEVGRGNENPTNGVGGWEAGVNIPPDLTILARQLFPPSSIDVGGPDNWIVGTGTRLAAVDPVTVVTYTAIFLVPTPPADLVVDLTTTVPSSTPGELSWVDWTFNEVNTFARWRNNRFVLNCVNEPECQAGANGVEITVGTGTAGAGSIDIPVTVRRADIALDGDPSQLAGLDLTVAWDSTLASITDVLLAPATSNWLMEFNPRSGMVDLSMAGLDAIDVPENDLPVLTLRFFVPGVPGTTPLSIVDSRAFDLNQQPILHTTTDGSLTTGCEKGDVIPDGEVNSADAIRTLLFAMGTLTPTPEEFCAADMNSDGTIDVGDAVLVLQKAVGVTPSAVPREPFVYVRSGNGPGNVVMYLENAAGLEVGMSYEPMAMTFVSASAPGSAGLTAVNDKEPGQLRLGFAKASSYTGNIELKFEVMDPGSPLHIDSMFAYDEYGNKIAVEPNAKDIVFGVTATDDVPATVTKLLAASPNPFNPRTELRFLLAQPGDATMTVYDLSGRRVREFRMPGLTAGPHSVTWAGRDDAGQQVASGTYLIRLEAAGIRDAGQVTLLK